MTVLAEPMSMLEQAAAVQLEGAVVEARGLVVRVADLPAPLGAMVTVSGRHGVTVRGEIVGFQDQHALVMPLGPMNGVRRGDRVIAEQFVQTVRVGNSLLGRVLNALGQPIDGKGPLSDTSRRPLTPVPVDPMRRPPIDQPLATGVRAIDSLLSVGRGQRLGVFAAPGVGKSTLLAMMARQTAADVSVISLVGERGRELRDFIEHQLGPEGLANSVVICATSDEPALLRIRAALVGCAIAEYFRDHGKDVLLIMDSVTRFCQAQRQVGLAAGEPPTTKGYTPSVFSTLPMLLERSGRTERGSITGFYAVLVEGDDMDDPIADAARGVLDGHIVLSRAISHKGHWPAIDVLQSISRLADEVADKQHQLARRQVLKLVHDYQQVEDLLTIGAYAAGSSPDYDLAIACKPAVDQLLQQGRSDSGRADFDKTRKQLLALVQHVEQAKAQLQRPATRGVTQPPRGNL